MGKIVPDSSRAGPAGSPVRKKSALPLVYGGGLQTPDLFVRLHPGWLATPRFSSLSGALMCDSKKGLQPRLLAGVFFGFGTLRLTLLHKVSLHRNPRCGL